MTRPALKALLPLIVVLPFAAAGCGSGANRPEPRPQERAVTAKSNGAAIISVSANRKVATVINGHLNDPRLTAQDISDALAELRCYDYTVQSTPITQRGYLTGVIVHCQRAAKGANSDDLR